MEAVEILLKYIKEFKTKVEFNGVDFDSRPIYPQCIQKYADAWRWIFRKILALKLFRNREKIKYFAFPPFWLFST